jgi:diguanylate cyclase (GGDEF)-like protein/PAS domain S-box-containing protein
MSVNAMQSHGRATRAFERTLALLGLAALAYSFIGLSSLAGAALAAVAATAAIAAVAAALPVRMPGTRATLANGEVFLFLLLLLHGAPAATLAAAAHGLAMPAPRPALRFMRAAMAAIAMLGCGLAFTAVRARLGAGPGASSLLLATVAAVGPAYFLARGALEAVARALRGEAQSDGGSAAAWTFVAHIAWAGIAGLLYASSLRVGPALLLVAIPTLALFQSTVHFSLQRMEARRRHLDEMRAADNRFLSAFHHAAIGMALVSREGSFTQVNRAFCDMLGRDEPSLVGTGCTAVLHPEDLPLLDQQVRPLLAGESPSVQLEMRGRHAAGHDVWLSLHVSFMTEHGDGAGTLIVQAQDVTARRDVEAQLYHNAYHDPLTQLANRNHFEEHLARAVARAVRNPAQRFAVMYLDFDRFKMVNDSLGHRAGDELLQNLALRLQAALRPADLIARLGGDEFAILLEDLQRERDAVDLAERIHRELARPFLLGGIEVSISASIGITYSAIGYRTSEAVVRDADIAMYKAKSRGKGQTAIFDSSLHDHVASQLKLENDLRRALGGSQLELQYQPIFELATRTCVGFEALARWRHPQLGLLGPARFIPTAEETGLIVPLGNWVVATACAQLRQWRDSMPASRRCASVNVSALQLAHRDFVPHVRHCIEENGLAPGQLTIEVTESVLMKGIDDGIATLRQLRALGVRLSVDDFGTGYSSLGSLATLPIDAFKIDRSFIDEMGRNPQRAEIVRAILRLGQALSKEVVAEGIETEAQARALRELGCRYGQGNLLGPPMEAPRAAAQAAPRAVAGALS